MLILRSPHQRVLECYLGGGSDPSQDVPVDEELARSWRRALARGASPQAPVDSARDPFVSEPEVRERRERHERTWRRARPILEGVHGQLERGGYVGIWADPDGVVLHQLAGGSFLSTAQRVELIEGAYWGEDARGTNAIGTAIAEGGDVAVIGPAHLQPSNHPLVCYASPVRGPDGQIVGVLDVSSRVECAHELAGAVVLAARQAIERELRMIAYHEATPGESGLALWRQVLEGCDSPAILLERDGTLRASNAPARQRFGPRCAPVLGALSWRRLVELAGQRAPIVELEEPGGPRGEWRVGLQWVGQGPDQAMAALVRLEPLGRRRLISPHGGNPDSTPSAAARAHEQEVFSEFYGTDAGLREARQLAARFAPTSLPVLLLAETGTGKDMIARAVHELSLRRAGPFVAVNCGAISESLFASELFGYAPGAFTGARPSGAEGKIAAADGGTLFLDEVAEMPSGSQSTLLRFLENRAYFRVGESSERRADVRVIAATSQDLRALVDDGQLRADLYYRLKGATITLPPVRQRDDLSVLCYGLLRDLAEELGWRGAPSMSRGFQALVEGYPWPGNVRELRHALHVALVLGDGTSVLEPEHLPEEIRTSQDFELDAGRADDDDEGIRHAAEAQALRVAMERSEGNISRAARLLGVARSTLYRMLERHGLKGS